MIIQSAVDHFNTTFDHKSSSAHKVDGNGDQGVNGGHTSKGRALPHIISSSMEHPAINTYLDHLEESGKAGLL